MWDSGFQDGKSWDKDSIPIQIRMICDKIRRFFFQCIALGEFPWCLEAETGQNLGGLQS